MATSHADTYMEEPEDGEVLLGFAGRADGAPWRSRVTKLLGLLTLAGALVAVVPLLSGKAASATRSPVAADGVGQMAPNVAQELIVKQEQPALGRPTLYCYSLSMPTGDEPSLLEKQFARKTGIWACEGYQVFSNAPFTVGNQYQVTVVPNLVMKVDHGGKWGTALNTDVFVQVWKYIAQLGTYSNYEWSVKADIDTVFFPERLRDLIAGEGNFGITIPREGPVWLNNCQWGMHGPIEALSRDAMANFLLRIDECEDIRKMGMDIDIPPGTLVEKHAFGEDQFMRECLMKLGAQKVDAMPTLLSERYACGERPKDCADARVVFHAFKTVQEWCVCINFAEASPAWPVSHPPSAPPEDHDEHFRCKDVDYSSWS